MRNFEPPFRTIAVLKRNNNQKQFNSIIYPEMETVEIVLNKMKELNAPVNATTIAKETGLDKKDVDKAMAQLKKEEKIFSPVRCKWQAK